MLSGRPSRLIAFENKSYKAMVTDFDVWGWSKSVELHGVALDHLLVFSVVQKY